MLTSRTITDYVCGCVTPLGDNGLVEPGNPFRQAVHGTGSVGDTPGSTLPPTRPAVVLDPFGGTGTTALVAKALGRHGITVDLSADYCRLAEWRCNDPRQLAAALQVEKPVPVPAAQLDLFGDEGG